MKKSILKTLFIFLFINFSNAQTTELVPQFLACEQQKNTTETCFLNEIHNHIKKNFKVPENQSFSGEIITLFEVDTVGKFKVLYIEAPEQKLKDEMSRVFALLPQVKPAKHNANTTYYKQSVKTVLPFTNAQNLIEKQTLLKIVNPYKITETKPQKVLPFTHQNYALFDKNINEIGIETHTSVKPYTANEVSYFFNLDTYNKSLFKNKTSWWGRKFWNENMVEIHDEDFSLILNPIADVRLGKDTQSDLNYTYQNTRGINVVGTIGKQVSFSATIFENQGRFADYYNQYAESIKPSGGNPAMIPGIGIAKEFDSQAYDFMSADANISYTPSKFFNFQMGYGRNFIGDGYRSLLMSDGASPYPYFKINTTFWKLKYTNIYTSLKDVNDYATLEKTYGSKYIASHYLSLNLTKRLNIGLFESVVWANTNNRGFDANFIVPIIFYRSVEFNSASKTGNALMGATAKYKFTNKIYAYGQFILDEFSINDMTKMNQSWKNKNGYQLGFKYFDAFSVKNLTLQAEYNQIRPYVYSHSSPLTNYGHNNQSIGHNWGANFRELIGIARYTYNRWFAEGKLIFGERGLDKNNLNYGGNIYLDYDENRPYDTSVAVAQGAKITQLNAELQIGYIINPSANLKLFTHLMYRNLSSDYSLATLNQTPTTTWFSVGLRSDLFNWYFDY